MSAPVTVENFARAETDNYLAINEKQAGIGKLKHNREPADIDNQTVIRLNRDTLYSFGVFDLQAAPVTITLPDTGQRFMSMQIINEDHFAPFVFYGHEPRTLTQENVGTRYVMVAIRTLADPNDPDDLAEVHKLQDAIQVSQASPGKLELPDWDPASLKEIRESLLVLASHADGFVHAFGPKGEVDPVKHLIGTAAGWGGNPDKDATYLGKNVPNNDGKAAYTVTVRDVPVDAFWSISVYNEGGFFEKNPQNAYSLNSLTAKKNEDGSITIRFGGDAGNLPNVLPIVPGWNYTVRLYRPRPEILDGTWKFPELVPVD
ncbi:uncharacterized protein DUF1254 [Novosphingobium sp. PhB165]|uniref:DUF1214 domain-containing protein n=1 Tax=Novosphingobium sp. PhB165 TaxID=2485105 RepID=UPI0010DE3F6B|nr:DUF1214 domain-containing protein [Novosphingobium sp. PhB165]TCM22442.1 uncharacterized protein DUF1254 [Novosphingobium sp. PhB165]